MSDDDFVTGGIIPDPSEDGDELDPNAIDSDEFLDDTEDDDLFEDDLALSDDEDDEADALFGEE